MGFLKGQWALLRGLRACVNNDKGLKYATLWITACIHLHAFAMDHEDALFTTCDQFYCNGQRMMHQERHAIREWQRKHENDMDVDYDGNDEENEVKQGKLKHEHLKAFFLHIYCNLIIGICKIVKEVTGQLQAAHVQLESFPTGPASQTSSNHELAEP